LISHHESANQTCGKRFDSRGSCPTFTGLTTPLVGDMSRVTLNSDLSKIPFVRF